MIGPDEKRLFDDRVAQAAPNKYRDDKPHQWLKVTRNYLISRCPEGAQRYLKWAEDRQKNRITPEDICDLRTQGDMYDVDPKVFSEQLWGFLNLQIDGENEAPNGRNKFDNVEALNGLEAWRRLVVPLDRDRWRIGMDCRTWYKHQCAPSRSTRSWMPSRCGTRT